MWNKRLVLSILCAALIAPALASAQTITADRFRLNAGPCYQRSGTGYPEGNQVGNPCDEWNKTDAPQGKYYKLSGTGNTGWLLIYLTDLQAATSVFAGPASGSPALPAFTTTPTLTGLTVNVNETVAALGAGTWTYAPSAPILTGTAAVFRQKAPGQPNFATDWWVDSATGTTYFVAYDTTGSVYKALKFQGSAIGLDADTTITGAATITGNTNISGYVGHPSFTSQTNKWRIDNLGGADFRYLYVDEMHAKTFIADLERALAGGEIISKSVAVLSDDFACPATPGIGSLSVEDLPGAPDMPAFEVGDYVVVRTFSRGSGSLTITDCVGSVSSPDTSPTGTQTWVFTRPTTGGGSAAPGTVSIAKGLALDYGVTGNGVVETTAVDGAYGINSPYTQIKTWTGTPASGNFTTRTRVGNLKGITGTAEWGALFGTWDATAGQYLLMSDQHFEIHGVKLQLFNGATEVMRLDPTAVSFAMGTTLPTSFTSGIGCWQGFDAGVFKWRCGDPSGATQYIGWNGTQLTVAGNIVVTGTSIDAATVTGVAGATVVSGAARGLLGIDSVGNPLLPHTATPSGSGLFLGSDFMGYYASGVWKSYFDSTGGMYLGGSSGALQWNGTTLTLTYGAGAVSGWVLSATAIKDAAGAVGLSSAVTAGNDCRFWAGNASCASAPFRVYEDGSIIATSGTFSGALSGATGTFAGSLSAATGTFAGSLSAATGTFAGSLSAATGSFSGTVTASSLTATVSGNIAGWLLSANSITDAAGLTGLSSVVTGGDDCRFYAGNVTCSSAPFHVTEGGVVAMTSGTIGAITIDSSGLTLTSGRIAAGGVTLDSGGLSLTAGTISSRTVQWTDGSKIGSNGGVIGIGDGSGISMSYGLTVSSSYIGTVGGLNFGSSFFNGVHDIYISGSILTDPSSTTSNDYPVVYSSGNHQFYHKNNGFNGSGGCSQVADIAVDRGIVTGVTCFSPTTTESEIAQLRREVGELREQLKALRSGGSR